MLAGIGLTPWLPAAQGLLAQDSFTPADIATELWLDADDASTLTMSGSNVTQWDDKSGNARHFSQGTASLQPTTGTVNGKTSILFDEVDEQRLENGSPVWDSGTHTVIEVFQPLSEFFFINPLTNGDTTGFIFVAENNSSSTTLNSNMGAVTYRHNGASITFSTRDDAFNTTGQGDPKNILTSTVGDLTTFSTAQVGRYSNIDTLNGHVCEVVVIKGDNASTIADVEGYLATKWGISI